MSPLPYRFWTFHFCDLEFKNQQYNCQKPCRFLREKRLPNHIKKHYFPLQFLPQNRTVTNSIHCTVLLLESAKDTVPKYEAFSFRILHHKPYRNKSENRTIQNDTEIKRLTNLMYGPVRAFLSKNCKLLIGISRFVVKKSTLELLNFCPL